MDSQYCKYVFIVLPCYLIFGFTYSLTCLAMVYQVEKEMVPDRMADPVSERMTRKQSPAMYLKKDNERKKDFSPQKIDYQM